MLASMIAFNFVKKTEWLILVTIGVAGYVVFGLGTITRTFLILFAVPVPWSQNPAELDIFIVACRFLSILLIFENVSRKYHVWTHAVEWLHI